MNNEEMRELSGNKEFDDRITCFMYLLLRNELPAGRVEELVMEAESANMPITYTNGWLAEYAKVLSKRLKNA